MDNEDIQKEALDLLKLRRFGQAAPTDLVKTVSEWAIRLRGGRRRRAILALGNMKPSLALPVLYQLVASSRSSIQVKLALKKQELEPRFESVEATRICIVKRLGEIGDARVVDHLITILDEGKSSKLRSEAAWALARLGDERAVKPLHKMLQDSDRHVRLRATEALREYKCVEVVEPLILALKDRSPEIRRCAAEVLGELGDGRAVRPLVVALRDRYERVRRSAIRALGQLWQMPDLIKLAHESPTRRQEAAASLGELKDMRTAEPLIAVLKDKYESVRWEAIIALASMGNAVLEYLPSAFQDSDRLARYGMIG